MSETCIHCQSWRDDCNEYLAEIESLRQQLTEAKKEIKRLEEWIEAAFVAHPNLDIDVEQGGGDATV